MNRQSRATRTAHESAMGYKYLRGVDICTRYDVTVDLTQQQQEKSDLCCSVKHADSIRGQPKVTRSSRWGDGGLGMTACRQATTLCNKCTQATSHNSTLLITAGPSARAAVVHPHYTTANGHTAKTTFCSKGKLVQLRRRRRSIKSVQAATLAVCSKS